MEWFGQIIVGPEVKPLHLVLNGVFGRDDDDAFLFTHPFEMGQDGKTASAGQHDVQQDTVVIVIVNLFHGRGIVFRTLHDELFAREVLPDGIPQLLFVFNQQDLHDCSVSDGLSMGNLSFFR